MQGLPGDGRNRTGTRKRPQNDPWGVHFSTGFFQKENIVYAGVLQIFRTKNQ
jgi:hypothetical protein